MNKKQRTTVIIWALLTLFFGGYIAYLFYDIDDNIFRQPEGHKIHAEYVILVAFTVWVTITLVLGALVALLAPAKSN